MRMMGVAAEGILSASKFRGCLIGALVGDCLGSPFEGDRTVSRSQLQKYLDKLEDPSLKVPTKSYTDDTAMTRSIAESLTECGKFNELDLAKRFVSSYYDGPRRGYGENVVAVFDQLRREKFKDVWGPARRQFDGSGSFGNGGAMRVAPVALLAHSNYDRMIDMARNCTHVTHTHRLGVNGSLLQCIAVQMGLAKDPKVPLDTDEFITHLTDRIIKIEKNDELLGNEEQFPYKNQMELIKKLLAKDPSEFEDEIAKQLGNSVAALYSVPTAIYCFLRAQRPVECINTDNAFRRVLQLSILMGGDTDTIASMACAIAGAYHGEELINKTLMKHCEGLTNIINLSDRLLEQAKKPS